MLAANLYRILGKKTDSTELTAKKDNSGYFEKDINGKEKTLINSKESLLKLDKDFNYDAFLEGAKRAFGLIVSAYKKGRLEDVKSYLSTNVYSAFDKAMEANEDDNSKNSFQILEIKATILNVEVIKEYVKIKVEFFSKQHNEQSEKDDINIKDVWTFEKEIKNKSPNWLLIEVNSE